jgi:hypothetical protein
MTESIGYKIDNWSTCLKMGCTCPSQSLDLESALVEMSLWTDPDGFRKTIQSNQLRFLDTDNYVFAVSHGIRSGVQLVDTNITQKFAGGAGLGIKQLGFVSGHSSGSVGAANVLEPPVRLPEEYLPLKLFYGAAQVSTAGYGSAFNIGIEQKGGPEKCKSIAATNDSKVCAGVAQIVLQQRLEALFRVVPLVVGAMTAHNAHYAMIWKRAHSTIPIDTNPSKDNVLAQAALKYAAEADSDTAGTSWLKCLLTLGVVGASGYGAWKYWPKSKK